MLWLRPNTAVVASVLWILPLVPLVPITFYVVRRQLGLSIISQLAGLMVPIGCSAAALAVLAVVAVLLHPASEVVMLAALVSTGMVSYFALVLMFDSEVRDLVSSLHRSLFRRLGEFVR
jgi:hypothetical protein